MGLEANIKFNFGHFRFEVYVVYFITIISQQRLRNVSQELKNWDQLDDIGLVFSPLAYPLVSPKNTEDGYSTGQ